MDKITDDVKKVLEKIGWGSVATASKGGVPNVSPKGSFKIVDEQPHGEPKGRNRHRGRRDCIRISAQGNRYTCG